MAQDTGPVSTALEHPLTATVGELLALERVAEHLDEAGDGSPRACHQAATELASRLDALAPDRLGTPLAGEIRRWIEHLDGLASREGVDGGKLARLRSLLEQLEQRFAADWGDYYRRLADDPWLTAYRRPGSGETGLVPDPGAWAVLGREAAAERVGRWQEAIAPLRTAAETGLRLMRDSISRRTVSCPPEGYRLELPGEAGSGLVRVEGPDHRIPVAVSADGGVQVRFLAPGDLAPAGETVQTTLGWFTL